MPKPEGPQFFGRRKGRPLRTQLKTLMQTKLEEVVLPLPYGDMEATGTSEAPRGVVASDGHLDLGGLFAHKPHDIYLEIGFGGGEHLAALAAAQPDTGFVGAEPFLNGVASLLRHMDQKALNNIRIWPDDVRLILPKLETASLAGAYVMFPDPWPKRRHASRRILNQSMLDALSRLIRPGGHLRMASDHPTAKIWLLAEAMAHKGFMWKAEKPTDWQNRPDDWPQTRYMAKGVREGRPSSWFDFIRC